MIDHLGINCADWARSKTFYDEHIAFHARDRDAVHAFYDTALKLGAESLHAPRLWPEYHPGYYGPFVRDPDGDNVEAVFHGAPPQ